MIIQKISNLRKNLPESKEIIIIGNGPCLNELGIDNVIKSEYHTFSLNNAYKFWLDEKPPTYWGSFDYFVNSDLKRYFPEIANTGVDMFTLSDFVHDNHIGFKKLSTTNLSFSDDPNNPGRIGNSATFAIQVAYWIGYRIFYICGVDSDYSTPHFSEEYYDEDNKYEHPNVDVFHTPSWGVIKKESVKRDFGVYNICKTSKLKIFPYKGLNFE